MYDAAAGLYTATFPYIWRYGFPRLHGWLAHELAGARTVLDAGTGPGYWARFLAEASDDRSVVGLDFSPEFIRQAQRTSAHPRVEYVVGDLHHTPFDDASFDGILCSGVLDTLPDPGSAFAECRRLLTPGGRLVLILRGRRGPVSKALERIFRTAVGASNALRSRSPSHAHVPEALWSRTPIVERVPALAANARLRVVHTQPGPLMSRAVLEAAV
jgi:ubiquinone/menaquinone biosynthesis C-methylase UbiE